MRRVTVVVTASLWRDVAEASEYVEGLRMDEAVHALSSQEPLRFTLKRLQLPSALSFEQSRHALIRYMTT